MGAKTRACSLLALVLAGCELMTDLDGLAGSRVCEGLCSDGGADAGEDTGATRLDASNAIDASDGSSAVDATDASDAFVASDALDASNPSDALDASSNVRVVQSVTANPTNGIATLAPTTAGNLITVILNCSTTGANATISDNAPGGTSTYVPTVQAVALQDGGSFCGVADVRYAKNVQAGITSVRVDWFSGTLTAWVLEIAGVSPSSTVVSNKIDNQAAAAVVTAPSVTPSTPAALVVSEVVGCGSVANVRAGSPFVGLTIQAGDGAAYLITSTPGSYGAAWDTSPGTWAGLSVAF